MDWGLSPRLEPGEPKRQLRAGRVARCDEALDRDGGDGSKRNAVAVMTGGDEQPRHLGDAEDRGVVVSCGRKPDQIASISIFSLEGSARRAPSSSASMPPAVIAGSKPASSKVAPTISRPSLFGARCTSSVQTTCEREPVLRLLRSARAWPFSGRIGMLIPCRNRMSALQTPLATITVAARQGPAAVVNSEIRPPEVSSAKTS